jgi:phage tail-like protein
MPDRHGPYRQMRFILELDGIVKAGFSRCHIPENRTNVVKYREGNDPPTRRKLWGLNEYGPLVLESGVTDDSVVLYEWRKKVEQGQVDEARGNVAIVLLDEEGNPGPRWEFKQAWPARYHGPQLDANRDAVAIERLVIAHEGMQRDSPKEDGGTTQTKSTKTKPESATVFEADTRADSVEKSRTETAEEVENPRRNQQDTEGDPKKKSEHTSRKENRSGDGKTERSG